MRQNRTIDNVARRSLYPTQAIASDDPLGPLPEGWGECLDSAQLDNPLHSFIHIRLIT